MTAQTILSQAIADEAFAGQPIQQVGDYAASRSLDGNAVAIADSGGWWIMRVEDLREIARVIL
jgi:hypothetical protein